MFLLYSQYTRHKSFAGGNIDVAVLELWEESLDGSGKSAICLTVQNDDMKDVLLEAEREHPWWHAASFSP